MGKSGIKDVRSQGDWRWGVREMGAEVMLSNSQTPQTPRLPTP